MSTFACGHCGASLAFDRVRTETCPFCASPNFVERPPAAGQPDPQFVVAFVGDAEVARRALDRWLGSRSMFADSALRRGRVEAMRGIYVPAYLYSAVAHTDYTAQIGEHYTESEEYTHTTPDGKTETRTRTVTRTEYRPLSGYHVGYVTDVVVSASQGLSNDELGRIEPFDFKQMRRFEHALVSGWIVEELAWTADECQHACRTEAVDHVGSKLRRFMPGDSYSDLSWRTNVAWESLDPILVPVWVLALRYRDNKDPLRVVINGQTGRVGGRVPLSWWKVTIGVIVLAAIAAAIAYLIYTRQR
ncbi:MAG TPA: hypothetical protein VFV99_10120 [Kofleriaceae bacterium]|nr:hypothetical protein [Kofleriaceae bacterium]